MSKFEVSFKKTSAFEGGYVNHPNDKGGETYKGIARNMWPQWVGWKIIDRYKGSPHSAKEMTRVLNGSIELEDMVEAFYRSHFWNPILGDELMNQLSADNIYDFAVNSGVSRAIKYAQRIVGVVEDGVMGPKTVKAINANVHRFVPDYKDARLQFVRKIVARDESQSVFLHGWETRITHA